MTGSGFFHRWTGVESDKIFNRFNLRTTRVRYGTNTEILPIPLVSYAKRDTATDVSSELSPTELLPSWTVSIPEEVLRSRFGSVEAGIAALQPGQIWYVNQNGTGWQACRVYGTCELGDGLRYGFKLMKASELFDL